MCVQQQDAAAHELQLMRRQLASAHNAQALAEKELAEVKEQASTSNTRVFQLEVELAELKQKLESMTGLEKVGSASNPGTLTARSVCSRRHRV